MSQENVETIRRMYERWRRDDAALFDAFDEDIEVHPDPASDWVGINDVYRGHDGLRRYMAQVYDAFEDYRPEVEQMLDAGDKVITLAVERGRGRGSGAEVRAHHTAHVWTMRAGKAVRLDLYLDRAQAFKAVGASEAVAVVLRLSEANERRDWDAVFDAYAADIEWEDTSGLWGDWGSAKGHEGIREAWRRWFQSFGDVRWEFAGDVVDAGDDVVATYRVRGRGRGSGVEVDQPLSLVWTVRDGKVVRVRAFLERDDALRAAGAGA